MLRPDIVITNEVTRRVTIVDVTIPFENRYQAYLLCLTQCCILTH